MSARILVVDDTLLNVKLLVAKLARDYYSVSTASTGQEALDMIAIEKPDLILLDIMMPGMSGFEVCQILKANPATKHIPIIIITALSDTQSRVRGLECGADDFLTKPFNDIALLARVRSLLRLKMTMDEWLMREETLATLTSDNPSHTDNESLLGKILLLEDMEDERRIISQSLKDIASEVTITNTHSELFTQAQLGHYDLLMISLDLPIGDGLHLCGQIRAKESTRTLPILLLANQDEVEMVAKGLDLGANDYILRPIERSELIARVRTQFRQKQHHDRLKEKLDQSLSLVLVDPLTGAYNRRYLNLHLPALFDRSRLTQRPLAVISLDLDHFKKINDTFGHTAGDIVLAETINRLQVNLRAADLVVRMGGEEFAIFMPDVTLEIAHSAAERLRLAIGKAPYSIDNKDKSINVSASFGVTVINYESDDTPKKILDRADAALYRAKESGRNKVVDA